MSKVKQTIIAEGYIGQKEKLSTIANILRKGFSQWAASIPHEGIDQKIKVTIEIEKV